MNEQVHGVATHVVLPEPSLIVDDLTCQDIQPNIMGASTSSDNLENFSQPPPCSILICEPLVNPTIDEVDTADKDMIMQCETAPNTDGGSLFNSNDNNLLQGNDEPIEMEVDKDKSVKGKQEIPSTLKETYCTGFPSAILGSGPIDEPFAPENEICPDNEIRDSTLHGCETTILKKGHTLSCDENMGPEETKRRKDTKRKPLSSDSKSIRVFTRPAGRNEDDSKNDECQFSSCSNGNNVGSCLNSTKPSLDPTKSGLFLYMDMHGHASKKGISIQFCPCL